MLRKQSYKKECIQYHSMYIDLFRDASIGNKLMKKSKNEIFLQEQGCWFLLGEGREF